MNDSNEDSLSNENHQIDNIDELNCLKRFLTNSFTDLQKEVNTKFNELDQKSDIMQNKQLDIINEIDNMKKYMTNFTNSNTDLQNEMKTKFDEMEQKSNDILNTQIAIIKEIEGMKKSMKSFTNSNADLQSEMKTKFDEMEQKSIDIQNKFGKMKNDSNEMKDKLISFEYDSKMICRDIDDIKINLTLIERKLFQPLDIFIWKVDGFSQLRKQNGHLYSDYFHSHQDGYRMRLVMFPNGTGTCRDTHLSVQFQVVEGDSDDRLKWPFNIRLNLQIIGNNSTTACLTKTSECHLKLNEMSPVFNFLVDDLVKNDAIKDDSIIIQCDLRELKFQFIVPTKKQ